MQPINPRRMSPAELEALTRRDRNRIIVLTLGAVVLGVGYLVTLFAGDRAREREAAEEPMMEARTNPEEQVIVPAFDDIDLLDAIEDSTEEQRLSISDEALDGLVFYSSMLLPRHFDQLGVTSLDAEMVSELQANPGEHRGEAYLARGMIVDLGRRQRSDKLEESTAPFASRTDRWSTWPRRTSPRASWVPATGQPSRGSSSRTGAARSEA